MAEPTTQAVEAASIPDPTLVKRAEAFTRERFLHDGEEASVALAPGSARRRALDAAVAEIDAGAKVPSTKWRRRYALLLGLERVLSEDEPRLADGTSLNPHQVDALSGTLVALMAATQKGANGTDAAAAPVLAVDDAPEPEPSRDEAPEPEPEDPDEDEDDDEDDEDEDRTPVDIEIEGLDDEDEDDESDEPAEEESYDDDEDDDVDEDVSEGAADDPNAGKRFWFEHATGAGKTVAAMGFVDASRTGGVLILTHRRNLVDQFLGELHTRGYGKRESPPLLDGEGTGRTDGPVTVETYQWFVRNAGRISDAYTIVICDEAHTALGEKTSAAIRAWTGPIFVGMTATGALIARHVTDLFPTQTSRFDLAQAARRGVIAPLRSIRIPPGPGVRTIAKVPLRKGEVDVEFDQEMLAELLDQLPFNLAIADLYKTRFNGVPGVVYAAGVRHAMNVAEAFRQEGIKAMGVSGETPKRELAEILARYERGEIDVLVNAQLLAEGWNSPRATICMHLAPTASKRIYQQRVGRVTRRHPGKESGIVVDFVHPATRHDDPVVTLHSLLDRDVYRGGAIVVGPVRRGRGRRVRVERRVIPVCADEDRRIEVFERELWRIAVEFLDYGEQVQWAALAGARVAPSGWRRARAMLHFDKSGELKRSFLLTAVERNKNSQLRLRALQEIAQSRDADAFERAVDVVRTWSRDERREGVKVLLQALAERRIGRRDQASHWIWDLADMTREVHEEYAVQRWPETKRLLGLLVNSSGGAHARNARRLVHAARKQDRRLSAAILAAAVAHTPEAMEVVRGARTRMARKPSALSRELLRNFPKRKTRGRRRRKKGDDAAKTPQMVGGAQNGGILEIGADSAVLEPVGAAGSNNGNGNGEGGEPGEGRSRSKRRSRSRRKANAKARAAAEAAAVAEGGGEEIGDAEAAGENGAEPARAPAAAATPAPVDDAEAARAIDAAASLLHPGRSGRRRAAARVEAVEVTEAVEPTEIVEPTEVVEVTELADEAPAPKRRRTPVRRPVADEPVADEAAVEETPKPKRRAPAKKKVVEEAGEAEAEADAEKPKRRRAPAKKQVAEEPAVDEAVGTVEAPGDEPKPKRRRAAAKKDDAAAPEAEATPAAKPKRRAPARKKAAAEPEAETAAEPAADKPKPRARRTPVRAAAAEPEQLALDAGDAPAEDAPKPKRARTARAKAADEPSSDPPPPEQLDDAA
ncbi:MAG TPA: DEAD/DEAH box helicase family protein [Baekduia sp.]|uniref:DEAD/DEAH box helicase n=1 Tax=Baekduia sp. TaxID=2600305 RepID=UPI002C11D8CF|nr:DEAD/DEAH box helicase family protein [Baekduia sp.]HMJ33851.1 DEAD/DEAH box helicase family protein [Baekduia sp.]